MWIPFTPDRVDSWLAWVNGLILVFGILLTLLAVAQFKLSALSDLFSDERIAANEAATQEAIAEARKAEERTAIAMLRIKELEESGLQVRLEFENSMAQGRLAYLNGERKRRLIAELKALSPKGPVRVLPVTRGGTPGSMAWSIRDALVEAGFDAGTDDDVFIGAPLSGYDVYFISTSIDPAPAHLYRLIPAFGHVGLYRSNFADTTGHVKDGEVGIVVCMPPDVTW